MTRHDSQIDGATHRRETERLRALHSLDLRDAAAAEDFDGITELAASMLRMPTALVSLIDADRQRFLSRHNFTVADTSRAVSICAHAIASPGIFEVPDLREDPRFQDNPLVTEVPLIRSYAGAPLVTTSGHAIGTLCVIDYVPRKLSEDERAQLAALARLVVSKIELRAAVGRRDPVSGLPNRQQLALDLAFLPQVTPGEHYGFMLVETIDLDELQRMNQALGMAPAESMVRRLGERLQRLCGASAAVYHVDATRFALLRRSDAAIGYPVGSTATMLDELLTALGRPMVVEDIAVRPVIHSGVLDFHATDAEVGDVMRRSITALNVSLQANSRWTVYAPAQDIALRRSYVIAASVQAALDDSQFSLAYQPRMDLASGRVLSVEALLRWHHPVFGDIGPAEFIPIIERTALMPAVTHWVLHAALAQLARWMDAGLPLGMSVNLSARDFDQDGIATRILAACVHHGVQPQRLEVEVTEGEWLATRPSAVRELRAISELGVQIAIDDFGSGYSNFAYLHQVPATVLKLDRSLVAGISGMARHRIAADAILGLAMRLGYRTVAEGVEDEATADILRRWRCDEAQGFFFARPMSAAQVEALAAGKIQDAGVHAAALDAAREPMPD